MILQKPTYLYHGSPKLLTRLEPRTARGVGVSKHRLTGIYATSSRVFATAFALPILPNEQGQLAWKLDWQGEQPCITIKAGLLDETGIGYIYQVAADSFEPLDELQWISYEAIEMLGYEVIHAKAYLHWIAHENNTSL
ncbi:MAG: hypothetical protein U0175_19960 [Caldilineaceae bacterium]